VILVFFYQRPCSDFMDMLRRIVVLLFLLFSDFKKRRFEGMGLRRLENFCFQVLDKSILTYLLTYLLTCYLTEANLWQSAATYEVVKQWWSSVSCRRLKGVMSIALTSPQLPLVLSINISL